MLDSLSKFFGFFSSAANHTADEQSKALSSSFRIKCGQCTRIGYFRDNNEDRLFVDASRGVYLVADGMGGQAAGEQASQAAIEIIPRQLQTLSRAERDHEAVRSALEAAVIKANSDIIAEGEADLSRQNMGTTVVMALVRGDFIYIAHVGDSRAYLIRSGTIEQKTTDHNLAEALHSAGQLSREERETHRFRHVLWKYLGSKETDKPDITVISIRDGDRILLSTDGLTGALTQEQILREVAQEPDLQKCCERLVQQALDAGSKDNVTCVLLEIEALPGSRPHEEEPGSDTRVMPALADGAVSYDPTASTLPNGKGPATIDDSTPDGDR